MTTFSEYGFFGALLLLGALFGLAGVLIPLLISPRTRGQKSADTYECGMDTVGTAWMRFDLTFYLFALIFVAFSVDVLYLLPVAVVYDDGTYAWRDFIEVTMFIGILSLALVYAWRMGVFDRFKAKRNTPAHTAGGKR